MYVLIPLLETLYHLKQNTVPFFFPSSSNSLYGAVY